MNKNNIEIIHPNYKDYLFLQEGKKIKKINFLLSIDTLYNKNSFKKFNFKLLSLIDKSFDNKIDNKISLFSKVGLSDKNCNYISKHEILYFNVKTPTTQFYYENNINEDLLQINFTQSPKKNMNYSIHNQFLYPKNKNHNKLPAINYFLITFNYSDIKNKYYKIWIHFMNHYYQKNNYIKKIQINDSNNLLNIKRWYVGQRINISNNIYLINRLEYERKTSSYIKYNNIFGNPHMNERITNKIYYNKISNELMIKYYLQKNLFLISGIGFYNLAYSPQFKKSHKIQNNIFSFFGNIEYNCYNNINIKLLGKYLFFNNNYNKYYLFFKIKKNIHYNYKVGSILLFYNISPLFNITLKKIFNKKEDFNKYFDDIQVNHIYSYIMNNYINIFFNLFNMKNYASHKVSKQEKNILKIYNLSLYKVIDINKLKYNFIIKLQNNNYKNDIINFPKIIVKNAIFYENIIYRKKILFQTGIALKYISNFLYKKSNLFINEIEDKVFIDNIKFPLLDGFINIEFFRIKIYLLAQNFNFYNFFYKNKSSLPININNEFIIKIGFLWQIFT